MLNSEITNEAFGTNLEIAKANTLDILKKFNNHNMLPNLSTCITLLYESVHSDVVEIHTYIKDNYNVDVPYKVITSIYMQKLLNSIGRGE